MAEGRIKFTVDSAPFDEAVSSFLALVDASNCPVKVLNRFANRALDLLNKGRAIDFDQSAATGANKFVIRLKPSNRLLSLMAAFRTLDSNARGV